MKKLGIIAMTFVLLMGVSQCKKENTNTSTNEGAKVNITLNVNGGHGSKVAVNTANGEVSFENNDVLYVASNGVYIGTLTYNGTNFNGYITDPIENQPLHFYFLGNVAPIESLVVGETSSCSVVINDQTEHLPVISYASSRENYQLGLTTYNATLLNKCALVKFNVTTSSEVATCITGMNNKVTVDLSTNEFAYTREGEGVITLPAGNGEKWVILLPQEAMENDGVAYSGNLDYIGTYGAVPSIVENGYLTTGIDVVLSVPGHEFVDLGLPSGLLWATCNVGADVPESIGDYFAWGEIQSKDYYDFSTYQHCNGDFRSLTKYCSNFRYGYNGFTDNLTTLEPVDDAATANWNGGWRMPTKEEWQELYQNTICTWNTLNDVYGRFFIASNGNTLFLPATGFRIEGSLNHTSEGYYWSSSVNMEYPYYAWRFYFNSDYCDLGGNIREYGQSVRAVHSPQ